MNLEIVWGTGEGETSLSAFDAALSAAGIHNYNLVTLSSVIPDGATVEPTGTHERAWDVGEVVSVVMAKNESTVPGETIAAGLGWATAAEGGIFFEEVADSPSNVEEFVTRGVRTAKDTRGTWDWEAGIDRQIVDHTVAENGAAVVAAVYGPIDAGVRSTSV